MYLAYATVVTNPFMYSIKILLKEICYSILSNAGRNVQNFLRTVTTRFAKGSRNLAYIGSSYMYLADATVVTNPFMYLIKILLDEIFYSILTVRF